MISALLAVAASSVLVFSSAAASQHTEPEDTTPKVAVRVIGPLDTFALPQGPSRLAFSTNGVARVVMAEDELVTLGAGSYPQWSDDGQFLVWVDHAVAETTKVHVHDSKVGQLFTLSSEDRGFSSELLLSRFRLPRRVH